MRAKLLRMEQDPAHRRPMIVTLDGPAGTGKSTVARLLACRLGVAFLDTGAMYRGLTLACLEQGASPEDEQRVAEVARGLDLRFDWSQDPPALLVGGRDVSQRIRERDVTASVSQVAANPQVRSLMVQWQRQIGLAHPRLVTEGRDQGSVVFPDALVKFYLVASAHVRARRRTDQLIEAGKDASYEQILQEIQERDERDASRAAGPLVRPRGSVLVDTSQMTLDEVVDHLHRQVMLVAGDDKGTSGHA